MNSVLGVVFMVILVLLGSKSGFGACFTVEDTWIRCADPDTGCSDQIPRSTCVIGGSSYCWGNQAWGLCCNSVQYSSDGLFGDCERNVGPRPPQGKLLFEEPVITVVVYAPGCQGRFDVVEVPMLFLQDAFKPSSVAVRQRGTDPIGVGS